MEGSWERMIQLCTRFLITHNMNNLNHLLQKQVVSDEVFMTVMAEAAHVLNTKPLPTVSNDPQDEQPLTPNHPLHLQSCPNLSPGIFEKEDMYCKKNGSKHNICPTCSGEDGEEVFACVTEKI